MNSENVFRAGTMFAPGIVYVGFVRLLIFMYFRSWLAHIAMIPGENIFRAGSNNFYYVLLLSCLFVVSLITGWLVVMQPPSFHCGPFSRQPTIHSIVAAKLKEYAVEDTDPEALSTLMWDFLSSPGFALPLVVLLCLIIWYLLTSKRILKHVNKDLKRELEHERTEEKRKVWSMAGGQAPKDVEAGGAEMRKMSVKRKSIAMAGLAPLSALEVKQNAKELIDAFSKLKLETPEAKIVYDYEEIPKVSLMDLVKRAAAAAEARSDEPEAGDNSGDKPPPSPNPTLTPNFDGLLQRKPAVKRKTNTRHGSKFLAKKYGGIWRTNVLQRLEERAVKEKEENSSSDDEVKEVKKPTKPPKKTKSKPESKAKDEKSKKKASNNNTKPDKKPKQEKTKTKSKPIKFK